MTRTEPLAPGVYRTPDERFEGLPDFPFAPHYVTLDDLRFHYLDEGPRDGSPVLLLHGEPSWCYLYRHMIPPLVEAGHRVIAPDLMGFGRSDKPASQKAHTHARHVAQMRALVETLGLEDITLFVQDWGGLIGLRVLAEQPGRFARVVAANTGLPSAKGLRAWIGNPVFRLMLWRQGRVSWEELMARPGFLRWAAYSQTVEDMPVGRIVMGDIDDNDHQRAAIRDAYDAPFPDARYKAGPRVMPRLVPSELRENERAWRALERWDRPFLTAFSDGDPITGGGEKTFQRRIPGARDQQHVTVRGAGHFLQETHGSELAGIIDRFMSQAREGGR